MKQGSGAPTGTAGNYPPPAVRGKRPFRWVIGVLVAEVAMIGLSAYAIAITPPRIMLTVLYWVGVVIFGVFGWVWLSADSIPGRRKRSRGPAHSWTIVGLTFIIGGFLGYIPPISPVAYGLFPAFLLSIGARLGWNYFYNGRIRFCERCGTYRWFFRLHGDWYCNKQGHKLSENSLQ